MAPQQTSQYPWVPNQAKIGFHVQNSGFLVAGLFQKQGGQYSFAPVVTAPGTVASAGTVVNSTGADCLVYLAAQTGISVVKVLSYNGANASSVTLPGTVAPLSVLPVYVPGPGAIAVTYAGTLNWTWVPV